MRIFQLSISSGGVIPRVTPDGLTSLGWRMYCILCSVYRYVDTNASTGLYSIRLTRYRRVKCTAINYYYNHWNINRVYIFYIYHLFYYLYCIYIYIIYFIYISFILYISHLLVVRFFLNSHQIKYRYPDTRNIQMCGTFTLYPMY